MSADGTMIVLRLFFISFLLYLFVKALEASALWFIFFVFLIIYIVIDHRAIGHLLSALFNGTAGQSVFLNQEKLIRQYHQEIEANARFVANKEKVLNSYNLLCLLECCGCTGVDEIQKKILSKGNQPNVKNNTKKRNNDVDIQTHLLPAKHPFPKGSAYFFGNYYYTRSTIAKKPVEWIVLESTPNELFLLSRFGLYVSAYGKEEKMNVTWSNSLIRGFLNNRFINEAFSSQEKERIIPSNNISLKAEKDTVEYTDDKVFLLSREEVSMLPQEKWKCYASEYCGEVSSYFLVFDFQKKNGVEYKEGNWWLRDTLEYASAIHAYCIQDYSYKKEIEVSVSRVDNEYMLVRPAIRVAI